MPAEAGKGGHRAAGLVFCPFLMQLDQSPVSKGATATKSQRLDLAYARRGIGGRGVGLRL